MNNCMPKEFYDLNEMGKFLETCDLFILNYEEIENPNKHK